MWRQEKKLCPYFLIKKQFALFLLHPFLTLWLQMTMARVSLSFIFQPPISKSTSEMLFMTFPCPFGFILSKSAELDKYRIPPEPCWDHCYCGFSFAISVSSPVQFNVHIALLLLKPLKAVPAPSLTWV